jgi:hypothetical protein
MPARLPAEASDDDMHRDSTPTTCIAGASAASCDDPEVPRIRRTWNPSAPSRVSLDWVTEVNASFWVVLESCLMNTLGAQVERAKLCKSHGLNQWLTSNSELKVLTDV